MEKKFDLDDELEMLLDDQLMKEAELLEKVLFADDGFEDYQETPEERKASFEKLVNRLKAEGIYRGDTVSENVSKENASKDNTSENADKEDIEKVIGKENGDNVDDEKEHKESSDKIVTLHAAEKTSKNKARRKFGRSLGKVASIVIVSGLCVFAASMTSEANRNYFLHNMRIMTGQDTRDVSDNDETNEKINISEYEAIAEIEEKLQINVPEFYYRPKNFNFIAYEVDVIAKIARIQYLLNEEIVDLYMVKCQENSVTNMGSVIGEEVWKVFMPYEDLEVYVEKITDSEDGLSSYLAKWKKDDVEYSMYGRFLYEELCKIIEKIAY